MKDFDSLGDTVVRISVTGHMDITDQSKVVTHSAIREELVALSLPSEWVGVSCIARGADSIFAETVLELGGNLEVVLPSRNYREKKVKPDHAPLFDRLIAKAAVVHVLPCDDADREAYETANNQLLHGCDRLIAIWDGKASKRGGTGTVVEAARAIAMPVSVIWPAGAARDNG